MNRKAALGILLLALSALGTSPALAQTGVGQNPADEILGALRDRGYVILEDERTWLGRQRVIAEKDSTRREVVFIPGTGEILRDYSVRLANGGDAVATGSVTVGTVGVVAGVAAAPVDTAPEVSISDAVGVGSTAPEAMIRSPGD